jgi:uncharacterized YkwD family protein
MILAEKGNLRGIFHLNLEEDNPTMKRLISLFGAALILLALAACGNQGSEMKAQSNRSMKSSSVATNLPFNMYLAQNNESIPDIASKFHVNIGDLLRLNPELTQRFDWNPSEPSIAIPSKSIDAPLPSSRPVAIPGNERLTRFEQQVLRLTNQERQKAGLSPCAGTNSNLNRSARAKSEDMADMNYFSHDSPNYGDPFTMMRNFGVQYRSAGENIAMGQRTPEQVVKAWMDSPGHRANIMNGSYNYLGVGYVLKNGNAYWTQQFIGK